MKGAHHRVADLFVELGAAAHRKPRSLEFAKHDVAEVRLGVHAVRPGLIQGSEDEPRSRHRFGGGGAREAAEQHLGVDLGLLPATHGGVRRDPAVGVLDDQWHQGV